MTTGKKAFEREFAEYSAHVKEVDAYIDHLMPDYNIPPADIDVNVESALDEQFARLAIAGLLNNKNRCVTDDELYTLKRDTVINLLTDSCITSDSSWINLINDIVIPDQPVVFDVETLAQLELSRQAAEEAHKAIQQDIADYYANLEREEQ